MVEMHQSLRYVDSTNPIHHHVFAKYGINDFSLQRSFLTKLKDKPHFLFGERTFRDACIDMGNFMGDKYWMTNVIFRFFENPWKPLLVSSVKNYDQIEFVRQSCNLSIHEILIVQITRPGYATSDGCRVPLVPNFTVENSGSTNELYQTFILKVNEFIENAQLNLDNLSDS